MKWIILAVASTLMAGCGPGVVDAVTPIAGGYYFSDAGGMEKTILYRGEAAQRGIVIDARVDQYRIRGDEILVARRPRIVNQESGEPLTTRLSDECEHWVIDTKKLRVARVGDSPSAAELSCRSPFDQEFNPRLE